MDLLKTLKEFKKIEPNKDYARRSKLEILGMARESEKRLVDWLWPSLRFSTATLITGLVIVLILVSFSVIKFSSPIRLTSLDPISLRAEAEAIDIQIQLTNLVYENPVEIVKETTTIAISQSGSPRAGGSEKVSTKSKSESPETKEVSEGGEEELTIDQTLELLAF